MSLKGLYTGKKKKLPPPRPSIADTMPNPSIFYHYKSATRTETKKEHERLCNHELIPRCPNGSYPVCPSCQNVTAAKVDTDEVVQLNRDITDTYVYNELLDIM